MSPGTRDSRDDLWESGRGSLWNMANLAETGGTLCINGTKLKVAGTLKGQARQAAAMEDGGDGWEEAGGPRSLSFPHLGQPHPHHPTPVPGTS